MAAASNNEKFRALVVDPNPHTRGFLWEAVLANSHFSIVTACRSSEESESHFRSGYECDVVLLSSTFETARRQALVSTMRETPGGKEAAIVTVVYATEQTAADLGILLAESSDGFVLCPFSVDSLSQVAGIASRVKAQFNRKRKIASATLILRDTFVLFDDFNRGLLRDTVPARIGDKMRELVTQARTIVDEDGAMFREALSAAADGIQPPKAIYQGPSQRIKKKLNR